MTSFYKNHYNSYNALTMKTCSVSMYEYSLDKDFIY